MKPDSGYYVRKDGFVAIEKRQKGRISDDWVKAIALTLIAVILAVVAMFAVAVAMAGSL